MPSIDTDGERGISHEDQIALAGAEPADAADEVLPRGHIQSGPAPGDQSQVRERLRSDTVVVVAPVRLVASACAAA